MIRPSNGFLMGKVIIKRDYKTESGIELTDFVDPRIRKAEVLEDSTGTFEPGVSVYIPMGFGTEFEVDKIEYVFVKPENIVGYEDDTVQG